MIRIPQGEFLLGCNKTSLGGEITIEAYSERLMFLPEFWIDRTPVTFGKYSQFLRDTEYTPPVRDRRRSWSDQFRKYLWSLDRTHTPGVEDMPVIFVTWYDACAYCEWAGKCLPTELKWEKAARGTDGRELPWGSDRRMAEYCNCCSDNFRDRVPDLTPVYQYPQGASPYGCLDMMGNANEWCYSHYIEAQPSIKPSGTISLDRLPIRRKDSDGLSVYVAGRVVRGCGRAIRISHVCDRIPEDPWVDSPYIGFRCSWHETTAQ